MMTVIFFLIKLLHPRSILTDTLFPYTTLFRAQSHHHRVERRAELVREHRLRQPAQGEGRDEQHARARRARRTPAGAPQPPREQQQRHAVQREDGQQARDPHRSEEHTSELQSLMRSSYAVFCLKKKNTRTTSNP